MKPPCKASCLQVSRDLSRVGVTAVWFPRGVGGRRVGAPLVFLALEQLEYPSPALLPSVAG